MILELNDIHTFYGTSHVLFGLSFGIGEGELVGLLGRNGAGKTTTLRSIIGMVPPQSGSIKFLGEQIIGKRIHHIVQLGIGFIPDNRRIFGNLRVRDNLEIAERGQGRNKSWTVDKIYQLFPQLKDLDKRTAAHLSGGEQQMLAIGRALMSNPRVLLMDEPTQGLSPLLVDRLLEQIIALKKEGLSILLCEQSLKVTVNLSDRIYIIDTGMIQYEGSAKELQEDKEVQEKYLLI